MQLDWFLCAWCLFLLKKDSVFAAEALRPRHLACNPNPVSHPAFEALAWEIRTSPHDTRVARRVDGLRMLHHVAVESKINCSPTEGPSRTPNMNPTSSLKAKTWWNMNPKIGRRPFRFQRNAGFEGLHRLFLELFESPKRATFNPQTSNNPPPFPPPATTHAR